MAGQPVAQTCPDLPDLPPAVGCAQQRCQAIASVGRQGCKQLLRRAAAVDHAEHLLVCAQTAAQRVARDRAEIGQRRAPERFIQSVRMRADLAYGKLRRELRKQRAERRLRRRAENRSRVVILHKLRDG